MGVLTRCAAYLQHADDVSQRLHLPGQQPFTKGPSLSRFPNGNVIGAGAPDHGLGADDDDEVGQDDDDDILPDISAVGDGAAADESLPLIADDINDAVESDRLTTIEINRSVRNTFGSDKQMSSERLLRVRQGRAVPSAAISFGCSEADDISVSSVLRTVVCVLVKSPGRINSVACSWTTQIRSCRCITSDKASCLFAPVLYECEWRVRCAIARRGCHNCCGPAPTNSNCWHCIGDS